MKRKVKEMKRKGKERKKAIKRKEMHHAIKERAG